MVGFFLPVIAANALVYLGESRRRKSPIAQGGYSWSLDDEGIRYASPAVSNWVAWSVIKRVREQQDRFVFVADGGELLPLPKRALSAEQIEAVRALVSRVKPELGNGR